MTSAAWRRSSRASDFSDHEVASSIPGQARLRSTTTLGKSFTLARAALLRAVVYFYRMTSAAGDVTVQRQDVGLTITRDREFYPRPGRGFAQRRWSSRSHTRGSFTFAARRWRRTAWWRNGRASDFSDHEVASSIPGQARLRSTTTLGKLFTPTWVVYFYRMTSAASRCDTQSPLRAYIETFVFVDDRWRSYSGFGRVGQQPGAASGAPGHKTRHAAQPEILTTPSSTSRHGQHVANKVGRSVR